MIRCGSELGKNGTATTGERESQSKIIQPIQASKCQWAESSACHSSQDHHTIIHVWGGRGALSMSDTACTHRKYNKNAAAFGLADTIIFSCMMTRLSLSHPQQSLSTDLSSRMRLACWPLWTKYVNVELVLRPRLNIPAIFTIVIPPATTDPANKGKLALSTKFGKVEGATFYPHTKIAMSEATHNVRLPSLQSTATFVFTYGIKIIWHYLLMVKRCSRGGRIWHTRQ